jgi:hypothetical protein
MKSKFLRFLCLAALLAGTSLTPAHAAVAIGNSQVQIGGFFSQGWLYSSNNNYPTQDKGGTWDFREMAVNVSTTIGSHLRVGGQAFSQRLGQIGGDKVILDWAVADYNFTPAIGLRVGRVKYPKGLYGEALDLDVVRPYIFLPNAVYNPVLRDFSASFDGAMLYGSLNAGKSSFDYKVFHGKIPVSPEKGVAEFFNDSNTGLYAAPGVSSLGLKSVTGGQLIWNAPVSGLRFVYSHSFFKDLESDGPFSAYPPVNLHFGFDRFTYQTVSAEYIQGNWVFSAEWQRSGGDYKYSAPPLTPVLSGSYGTDGWYVAASRRLSEKFELGAYYGDLQARYGSGGSRNYQHDLALSLRYDVNEHVLFKIEAHDIAGTYQTFDTSRISNPPAGLDKNTTVLAVKTTLSF